MITGLLNEGIGTTLGFIIIGAVALGIWWIIDKFTN